MRRVLALFSLITRMLPVHYLHDLHRFCKMNVPLMPGHFWWRIDVQIDYFRLESRYNYALLFHLCHL